jgi:hypothetical protein
MPVQGVESPHPESTARAICEFCDARSNASLADAALHDWSMKSSGELRFVMANAAADIGIISIHMRNMQPRACSRKFRILFAAESENVAYKSVVTLFDRFVKPGPTLSKEIFRLIT